MVAARQNQTPVYPVMANNRTKPHLIADTPLAPNVLELLEPHVEVLDWPKGNAASNVAAIYTYGHPRVDGALLDRLPGVRVVSNFGVGVDHIDVPAATARGIP